MRYAWIKEHSGAYPIVVACEVLGVSTSGYYEWASRAPSSRERANLKLVETIGQIHEASRKTYGSPRIHAQLRGLGHHLSRGKVARLMREHGIRAKTKRKFKVTTNSKHGYPASPNLVARNFTPSEANRVWASDITYVRTGEGWLYLCVVLDLYSRKVVGWAMSDRLKQEIATFALKAALRSRRPSRGLVFHSDQGIQYAAGGFRRVLWASGIVQSMSGKGACTDNAVAESFFHTLKTEFVYHESFATREEAKRKIFEWIEVFYNRQRLHSTNGYRSPEDFELDVKAKRA